MTTSPIGSDTRRGIPDWLALFLGVLVGEFHRFFLSLLLAAMALIAFGARLEEQHGYAWFLSFDLIFQWVGLLIVFLVATTLSRSRNARFVHWLAALSLVTDHAVRFATGQYASSDAWWYHLGVPLGVVFVWAVTLRLVARKYGAR